MNWVAKTSLKSHSKINKPTFDVHGSCRSLDREPWSDGRALVLLCLSISSQLSVACPLGFEVTKCTSQDFYQVAMQPTRLHANLRKLTVESFHVFLCPRMHQERLRACTLHALPVLRLRPPTGSFSAIAGATDFCVETEAAVC